MITDIGRGHIRFQTAEGKSATIEIDVFLRGYGSPDFVIYPSSLRAWDPSNDGIPLSDGERDDVLRQVTDELTEDGKTFAMA